MSVYSQKFKKLEKADKPKNNIQNQEVEYALEMPWVSEFTEMEAKKFHEFIIAKFEENPYRPIIIPINSYGGEVTALFSMLDTMDAVRSQAPEQFKFITVAKGKAISAGAVLLSYGDYRFSDPRAQIMIHQVVGGNWGSQAANEVEFLESSRMNAQLLTILRERCKLNMSLQDFKQKLSHNLYLTPTEAKDFGLIDVIGYPQIVELTQFELRVLNGEEPKKEVKSANRRTNKKSPKNKSKD